MVFANPKLQRMLHVLSLAGLCVLLTLGGAAATGGSGREFEFEDPLASESYRYISDDVCDMREGFHTGDYAEVTDVYENGRYAVRSDGSKRIPKAVMDRIYTDEKFYEDMLDYGFPDSQFGLWMGDAVYGTGPYGDEDVRRAAGQSWARVYEVVYILHEMDAGVTRAGNGIWDEAAVEIEDAYGVYYGRGKCALKKFAEHTARSAATQVTEAFITMREAAWDQDLETVQEARDKVVDALMVVLLQATLDTIGSRSAPDNAKKAIEAYAAPSAPDAFSDLLNLLDITCEYNCADFGHDNKKLRHAIEEVADANNLHL